MPFRNKSIDSTVCGVGETPMPQMGRDRPSSRLVKGLAFVATFMVMLGLTGCQVATVTEPVTVKFGADDADSQLDFWHELALRPLASNDDATHALILFVDGKDGTASYEARVAALKGRKLLPGGFDAPAKEAVQRGMLAYGLAAALNIHGGVTMMVFGNSERYATRELVDLGIFPLSSPNQTFSGTELVGIFGKAEDYQRGGGGEKAPGSLAVDAPTHEAVMPATTQPAPPGAQIAPMPPPNPPAPSHP